MFEVNTVNAVTAIACICAGIMIVATLVRLVLA